MKTLQSRFTIITLMALALASISGASFAQENVPPTPLGVSPTVPVPPLSPPMVEATEAMEQTMKSLDKLLEDALRNNPKIALAESKLQQAQVELRAAQMEVAEQLTKLHRDSDLFRKEMENAKARLEEQMKFANAGVMPLRANMASEELLRKKLELDGALSQMKFLAGQGQGAFLRTFAPPKAFAPSTPRPALKEDSPIAKALKTPITLTFEDLEVGELSRMISEWTGVNFVTDEDIQDLPITVTLTDLTLKQTLLAISDLKSSLCFVIRPGYILCTTRERAQTINAPTIPEDIPLFLPHR